LYEAPGAIRGKEIAVPLSSEEEDSRLRLNAAREAHLEAKKQEAKRKEDRALQVTADDIEDAFDRQNERLDDLSSAIHFAQEGQDELIDLLKKAGIDWDSKAAADIRDDVERDFPEPVDTYEPESSDQVLAFLGLIDEEEDEEVDEE
jgi:hypothetical protein